MISLVSDSLIRRVFVVVLVVNGGLWSVLEAIIIIRIFHSYFFSTIHIF